MYYNYSRLSDDLDYVKLFEDEKISKEDKETQSEYENIKNTENTENIDNNEKENNIKHTEKYNIIIKNNFTYTNYIKFKNKRTFLKKSVLIFKILSSLSLIISFM